MLGARTAAWSGKALPYDAEVEWIGTPYYSNNAPQQYSIDTGFVIGDRNDIVITCDARVPRPTQWSSLFMSYVSESAQSTRVICFSGNNLTYCGYRRKASEQNMLNVDIRQRNVYRLTESQIAINGRVYNLYQPSGPENHSPLSIFSRSNGVYSYSAERMVYSFKIESTGGEVYFDGIPVLKDGIAYMYDRVSGKLFGNALDGVFMFGPNKVGTEVARGGGY